MKPDYKNIEWSTLRKKIHGEQLSETEESAFSQWIEADISHKRYFEKACKEWMSPTPQLECGTDSLFDDLCAAAGIDNPCRKPARKFHFNIRHIAAAAIIAIGACLYMFNSRPVADMPANEPETAVQQPVAPSDHRQACLILADGKTVDLTTSTDKKIQQKSDGTEISVENGNIVFDGQQAAEKESMNTLVIPRGGEYTLQLSDGTRIWLNAKTTLRFPSSFLADNRTVYLEGEAYFEVVKDATRQFRIVTGESEIKVYGTSFNIRAYPAESVQATTLVEGSVAVKFNNREYMLSPGQQARVEADSRSVDVVSVAPSVYCSWHKGYFIFENSTLEKILNQLEDWYCVDFVYTDQSLRHLHFTGDLERYSDINDILSMISLTTNVEFTVAGNTVTVNRINQSNL